MHFYQLFLLRILLVKIKMVLFENIKSNIENIFIFDNQKYNIILLKIYIMVWGYIVPIYKIRNYQFRAVKCFLISTGKSWSKYPVLKYPINKNPRLKKQTDI